MNDLHQLREDFKAHAESDEAFQKESIGRDKDIQSKLDAQPTKEDIAIIVENVIRSTLLSKGKLVYTGLITVAGIVAALAVIFGGFKVLATFLFFPRS